MQSYGPSKAERDAWVIAQRGARVPVDEAEPYGFFVEPEPGPAGQILSVATILLTNRECPWRCVMCDLWKHTLPHSVAAGSIPAQIRYALDRLPPAQVVKLYNSGSFFDRAAIPPDDYPAIAALLKSFDRVIVESHPALVGSLTLQFRNLLPGRLEVAMGLETAHPEVLARLNKGMTLPLFAQAARRLAGNDIDLRTFILLQPPFLPPQEALPWAHRSLQFAFAQGATAATLIPTRAGNGAMERLEEQGHFQPPEITALESALDRGLALQEGRVFADTWDLQPAAATCPACFEGRVTRLIATNQTQQIQPPVHCTACESRR